MSEIGPCVMRYACVVIVLSACRTVQIVTNAGSVANVAEIFELVVSVASDSVRGLPVRVDPRPITIAAGVTSSGLSLAPNSDSATAARLRVLRRLRIDTVDATV